MHELLVFILLQWLHRCAVILFDKFAKKEEPCVSSACVAEILLATDHVRIASRLVFFVAESLCIVHNHITPEDGPRWTVMWPCNRWWCRWRWLVRRRWQSWPPAAGSKEPNVNCSLGEGWALYTTITGTPSGWKGIVMILLRRRCIMWRRATSLAFWLKGRVHQMLGCLVSWMSAWLEWSFSDLDVSLIFWFWFLSGDMAAQVLMSGQRCDYLSSGCIDAINPMSGYPKRHLFHQNLAKLCQLAVPHTDGMQKVFSPIKQSQE